MALGSLTRRLLTVVLGLVAAAGAEQAELASLVRQLGDEDFEKREAATARLEKIGEPALAALDDARTSDDPEVRRRARHLTEAIENRIYREHLPLTGHAGAVWTVAVSADGKRLLTGGEDGTLRLWDAATGQQLRVFRGHGDYVYAAALSPDGRRVLSGAGDSDAATGTEIRRMKGHDFAVEGVAFGADGKALSVSNDDTLRRWDLESGQAVGKRVAHAQCVSGLAYSAAPNLAATCGHYDPVVRLWDADTGAPVRGLTGHTGGVGAVCFSGDGKRLASAGCVYVRGEDATLRIWDVATGEVVRLIDGVAASCVAFAPDGKRVVTGGERDGAVRVWDVATGTELRKYDGQPGQVRAVAFFPDGRRLAAAGPAGAVRIWRAPR